MSTHNICFHGERKKGIMWLPPLVWSYELFQIHYVFNVNIKLHGLQVNYICGKIFDP